MTLAQGAMALQAPDVLLAGYADDIQMVAATLAGCPVRLQRAPEDTMDLLAARGESGSVWNGLTFVYVFSRDAGASSQLKSLFLYLHVHLAPVREVAVLLPGVAWEDVFYPEIRDMATTPLANLRHYLFE